MSPSGDRQKQDATSGLTPLQIAVGLGVAASAWVVVELLRRVL